MFSLYAQNNVYNIDFYPGSSDFLKGSISKCFVFNCQVTLSIEEPRRHLKKLVIISAGSQWTMSCRQFRDTPRFLYIFSFLVDFRVDILKLFLHTEYQCLCMLIRRGAEECNLVLFTRLGYILQYQMCLVQQVL